MPICKICDRGRLLRVRVYRLDAVLGTIGNVLVVLGGLGVLGALNQALAVGGARPELAEAQHATAILLLEASFACGLVGLLLALRKTLLHCERGGLALPAS